MENKQNIKDLIEKFYPYAKESLGFDHPVRVIMRQDAENAQQSLGKTAYYDPAEKLIVLYITDRHPKDVLRSFSHELVHHAQNCRGELDDLSTDDHYAKDGKGREIEKEAYLQGNFNVRDYEDNIKFKGVKEMKMTKSQLKSVIQDTIGMLSEGKMPMKDEPEGEDLNKDGKKGHGKVPAFLDEQQMDMNAIANVMEELRQLSDMDSSASRNLQRMGQEQFFRVLADKLEKAMEGQVASLGSSGELEEQEEVEEGTQPPKPKLPSNWKSLPSNDPARVAYRDWMKNYGPKAKSRTADAKKQIAFMKSLGDKDPIAAVTADPEKTADAKKQIALMKGFKLEENNDAWYNSSLYESLKSKWTKQGDK